MSFAVSDEYTTIRDSQADFDLCQRVQLYLAHTGHAPVRSIQVQADAGVITISGTAPTYYVRQLALACTRRVAGVQRVVDEIVVLPAKPRATAGRLSTLSGRMTPSPAPEHVNYSITAGLQRHGGWKWLV